MVKVADLSVELAGIRLKNPIIVGAGPNSKNFPEARRCIEAGFGAVVIRSLHRQHVDEIIPPQREFWNILSDSKHFLKSTYSFQSTVAPAQRVNYDVAPGFGGAAPLPTLDEWAEEVRKITQCAKKHDCVIIASLGWCGSNLSDEELWKAEARAMTDAGVDALELHTGPSPATEPGRYIMTDTEKYLIMPIKLAKQASALPIFVKIPVDCCDTVAMASAAQEAGADGVVPVTRWASLSIDTQHERDAVWRAPGIGGPWSVPIMNGLVFRMRHASQPIGYLFGDPSKQFQNAVPITVPIIPSGGVRFGADIIGYIMAGANAAEICTQVIIEGPDMARRIEGEIRRWMEQKGYKRIDEFRGILRLLKPSQAKDIPQYLPLVDEDLCNACMNCIKACPNQAIDMLDNTACIDGNRCEGCRTCYYICPTDAISLSP
jgi:dihydroorotate dehydrogenase/Pyruvate/2-oxoacid:ferredoxin oxidoreductase delta subunit